MSRALVLGAAPGNIGAAIQQNMEDRGWGIVDSHDCYDKRTKAYRIPVLEYEGYDALVVTLGKEGVQPWLEASFDEVATLVHANLLLPLAALHVWAQARQREGTAVVIGSYAHDHVLTHGTAYCAAKAGLAHAVRSLGWELTGRGLNFHIVHPYHVPATPMGQRVVLSMMRERGMTEKEAREYQAKDLQLEYHLEPREIAEYVGWLCAAPEAAWLSGQGLNLYGGVR
jgi:3-oxoacyl-[acyl-carrier protein] reductase